MADDGVLTLARMLQDTQSELLLLRRVVARHIADGVASGVPAAGVLARSLMTELDAAGLPIDVEVERLSGSRAAAGGAA